MHRVEDEAGGVDVLVNNAGIGETGSFLDSTPAGLETTVRLNLSVPLELCRQAIPRMVRRGGGHLVNVGSLAAVAYVPGMATYAATKAGLVHGSEAIRFELKGLPVGVTTVLVGGVQTDLLRDGSSTHRSTRGSSACATRSSRPTPTPTSSPAPWSTPSRRTGRWCGSRGGRPRSWPPAGCPAGWWSGCSPGSPAEPERAGYRSVQIGGRFSAKAASPSAASSSPVWTVSIGCRSRRASPAAWSHTRRTRPVRAGARRRTWPPARRPARPRSRRVGGRHAGEADGAASSASTRRPVICSSSATLGGIDRSIGTVIM